jgi:ABC-type multidrug transport system fused ATPase/permease subunit
LCFGLGVAGFLQKALFSLTGENLTYDVRCLLFKSLIYKEVSWYDRKDKAPGVLSNILSEDITNLNGLTTEGVATLTEAFLSLAVGILVSAIYEWRMALVCLGATPLVLVGGMLMSRLQWSKAGGGPNAKAASQDLAGKTLLDPYAESNALLSDVILNYRTIISFGQVNIDFIMSKYEKLLEGPAKQRVANAHLAGLAFGYSLSIRFIYIGVIFYVGSTFIMKLHLDS